jgi:flagellin-like protein
MFCFLLRFLLTGWWVSLKRFGGDRRGVSPVLSTVILVLIVVLGMSVVFAFFVDYVSDYQRGRGSSVMELVEIEDVYFKRLGEVDYVDVWLYNYGEIEVEVDAVYVDGLKMNISRFDDDFSLGLYEHKMFNVTLSGGWVSGGSYVFRFVTARGSAVEREYHSPKVV